MDLILLILVLILIINPPFLSDEYISELDNFCEENLTMEEKPIKITIDNYCGQRITFTMSEDAEIESLFELDTDSIKITHVSINAYDEDILIEKEDLT